MPFIFASKELIREISYKFFINRKSHLIEPIIGVDLFFNNDCSPIISAISPDNGTYNIFVILFIIFCIIFRFCNSQAENEFEIENMFKIVVYSFR